MERARAPAAAAPTRPAGWGEWLRIGFAARAFGFFVGFFFFFVGFFAKTKLVSAFGKTLTKYKLIYFFNING